jgi:hypothetical protein
VVTVVVVVMVVLVLATGATPAIGGAEASNSARAAPEVSRVRVATGAACTIGATGVDAVTEALAVAYPPLASPPLLAEPSAPYEIEECSSYAVPLQAVSIERSTSEDERAVWRMIVRPPWVRSVERRSTRRA